MHGIKQLSNHVRCRNPTRVGKISFPNKILPAFTLPCLVRGVFNERGIRTVALLFDGAGGGIQRIGLRNVWILNVTGCESFIKRMRAGASQF
jgi:hypothetical protein